MSRASATERSWQDPIIRQKRSSGISLAQRERAHDMSRITSALWQNEDYRLQQKNARAKKRAFAQLKWPHIHCEQCGVEFVIYPCRLGITKFCKRECQTAYKKGRPNLKNRGRTPSRRGGSGISGTYKKRLFRSLYELSFIINVLEMNNIDATYEEISIPLPSGGNYIPDFVSHQTKTIYEIKYAKALTQPKVALKLEAGRRYAEEIGYKFDVYTELCMRVFSLDEIIHMIKAGDVTLHTKRNGGVVYKRLMKKLHG